MDQDYKPLEPGHYFVGRYLFDVKKVGGDLYDVTQYLVVPEDARTEIMPTERMTAHDWNTKMPYKASIPIDRDSMQGLILSIFGEEL